MSERDDLTPGTLYLAPLNGRPPLQLDNLLSDPPAASADTARYARIGLHAENLAHSHGWIPAEGEGAIEFMLRRAREVALEDAFDPERSPQQRRYEGELTALRGELSAFQRCGRADCPVKR